LKRRSNQRGSATASGAAFRPHADNIYIAFWKPYGVITQFTADGSDKQTLAAFEFPPDVYPVGRLDHDSEGLILLSDDSALNASLLQPERGHTRTYLAQVENIPTDAALKSLREGVMIEGRRTLPADAGLLREEPDLPPRPVPIRERKNIPTAWIELTLTEGKNRQVRKMTAAAGHPTLRLIRVAIGNLWLDELELDPGEWVELKPKDVLLAFD
jgi:23S rRNA pseudouridine2457 synthase